PDQKGGVDLSGGQWLKLALARAVYAVNAGATVLVLDEPASVLDVRAEAELIRQYLDLTSGMTSLVISHRLSVVRDVRRICVVRRGRIIEDGSHDELIRLSGEYAQMFEFQAESYTDEAGSPRLCSLSGRMDRYLLPFGAVFRGRAVRAARRPVCVR